MLFRSDVILDVSDRAGPVMGLIVRRHDGVLTWFLGGRRQARELDQLSPTVSCTILGVRVACGDVRQRSEGVPGPGSGAGPFTCLGVAPETGLRTPWDPLSEVSPDVML